MGASTIPAGGASGGLQPKYQKFTTSGTFTLPDGYGAAKPLLVTLQIIGGGGGGSPQGATLNAGSSAFSVRFNNYFGQNGQGNFVTNSTLNASLQNLDGRGGGSGGIASTQMYLTSNLTITVGAAGTALSTVNMPGGVVINSADNSWFNSSPRSINASLAGTAAGSGGTTTAGSVSAAGGNGASANSATFSFTHTNGQFSGTNNSGTITVNAMSAPSSIDGGAHGTGGTPSGTAGGATPLLGTLAGGSGNTTPIFGSFGISGKRGDVGTNTGVEGTGGGAGAVGAPGAVILTWWQ